MSKYASFYAPINQALQQFNAQINENARQRDAAEYRLAQTQLAGAQLTAQLQDPRRILALQQAEEQLRPTPINISGNKPMHGNGNDRFSMEQWNQFKPLVGSIVGDPGVRINEDGTLTGSDSKQKILPKWQATKIQNRINAAQMFMFDEDTMRRGAIESTRNDIRSLEEEYKKTKNPATQMQIKGLNTKLGRMESEYNNPSRRLISLQSKMANLDREMAKAYLSDSPDSGWVSTLKDMAARTQDEYNALLKAMGKTGNAEGIQLKRYVNPTTGQVIEYPISKFDGARFTLTNPVAGGERHMGTFVLENSGAKSLSPQEQYQMVEGYISDYEKRGKEITALKNSLEADANGEAIVKSMNITDPDIIAVITQSKVNPDAVKKQIADLEGTRKRLETEWMDMFTDKGVRNRLDIFFGKQKDDPEGLLNTPTGKSKYAGSGIPDVLIQK